jgi:hypothetical protein
VALLALFVALGGTGYALTQLPKNSVGAKQLRKGAVRKAELRRSAVSGPKVRDDSLTGSDVLEPSLAKVPAAVRADSAGRSDSATRADYALHAHQAETAAALAGQTAADFVPSGALVRFGRVTIPLINSGPRTMVEIGSVRVTATCSFSPSQASADLLMGGGGRASTNGSTASAIASGVDLLTGRDQRRLWLDLVHRPGPGRSSSPRRGDRGQGRVELHVRRVRGRGLTRRPWLA